MKQEYLEDEMNIYEDKARELSGYDDASLLREADAAEHAWQQEKEAHPEEAAKIEQAADLNFDILMSKINSEGLKPVSERGYSRRLKRENRDIAGAKTINKKMVMLVAVAAVLIVGGSISATARSGFQYRTYPEQNTRNNLYRSNDLVEVNVEELNDVYKEIEKHIDIPVLALGYMPEEMRFSRLLISEKYAIIELKYDGKCFYLKETKPNASTRAAVSVSDRKTCKGVENYWLNKTLQIEKNELEQNMTEYSVNVETDQGYYYLSGITSEEIFTQMAENLIFR